MAGYWSQMTSPSNSTLYSVWGRSASDIYAVGNGTVLHYDGLGWSVDTSFIANWNGTASTNDTLDIVLSDVSGDSSNVFVVGDSTKSVVFRYNGGSWGNMTLADNASNMSVWVAPDGGPFKVYVVGERGGIQYYDGSSWSNMTSPQNSTRYADVWGTSYDSVWAVHVNTTVDNASSAVVAGAKYDGSSWSNSSLEGVSSESIAFMNAVYAETPSIVVAAGYMSNSTVNGSSVFHYSSGSWWFNATSPYGDGELFGVWTAGGKVWAVGEKGTLVTYDGGSNWNSTRFTYNNTFQGPDNGSSYTADTYGGALNGIWGTNSSSYMQIFAVGENGTILQFIDGAPTISSFIASPNSGVAPLSVNLSCTASDVNGTIASYRWDVNGDGSVDYVSGASNSSLDFVYSSAGTHNATVTVVDDDLLSATASALVTVTSASNATNSTPPTIFSWVASPQSGIAPLAVTFTLTAYDAEGIAAFEYDFKNDDTAVEFTTVAANTTDINAGSANGTRPYTYSSVGNYVANATVWDSQNASSSIIRRITVTAGSAPVVSGLTASPSTGSLPLAVTFTVAASDADSDLAFYDFDFNGDGAYDRSVNATLASTTTYTYLTAGTYAAKARARDEAGNAVVSPTASVTVRHSQVAGASNQSATVSSVTVNTQDTFPMSSSALVKNYGIEDYNFASLSDVREFTSAVAPATGVPATYSYSFSGVSQNIAELRLYKLISSGYTPFHYASAPAHDTDGAWWITTAAGDYLSPSQSVTASNAYQVWFVIKDNGPYDLDTALGSIRDPQVLGAVPVVGGGGGIAGSSGGGGGGGGGGGCTLSPQAHPGLEMLLLLGLAAFLVSRGRAGRRR